ncbi:hypothetical protein F4692_003268 [Nocardioides cavernae]|uniref:Uncharacterized protein n=1 Tax=Nocardioides cavernae TaxID=1921566 RepID=A0A7Y9H557_9ACTN|nr:hypothetical protein [Nocardioides cavernae]NYE38123.1 hypothetical protein [Nocardioides cavernae]
MLTPQRCPRCGHGEPHLRSTPTRADDAYGCEACAGCDRTRSRLRIPTSFRLAHLLLLRQVDGVAAHLGVEVVSLQEVAGEYAARLRRDDLLGEGVGPCWGDVGWLVHDLEDWDLLDLHRALARPLTARSRGAHPVVAGVSLSQRGATVVRLLDG